MVIQQVLGSKLELCPCYNNEAMNLINLLRSFRIGPFAIFDFAGTYLLAYLIGPHLKKIGIPLSREQFMYLVLPLSVLVHFLFGIETPLTEMILAPNEHYIWKGILILMIVLSVMRRPKKV